MSAPLPAVLPAGQAAHSWRALFAFVLMGALVLLVAAAATVCFAEQTSFIAHVIVAEACLAALAAFGPFALRAVRGGKVDALEPGAVFCFSYALVFCARPLLLMSPWSRYVYTEKAEMYHRLAVSEEALALAVLYGLFGIVSFHFGYRTVGRARPFRPADAPEWDSRRINHVTAAGVIMAALSIAAFSTRLPDLSTVYANVGRVGRDFYEGFGYFSVGMNFLSVVILLVWADRLRGRKRALLWLLLAVSNIWFLVMGGRHNVINLWASMYIAARYLTRTVRMRQIVAGVLVFVLIVGLAISAGDSRTGTFTGVDDAMTTWRKDVPEIVVRILLEFGTIDIFAMCITVGPEVFPILWGESYLWLGTHAVPRWLWPDKPKPIEQRIGLYVAGLDWGMPAGVVGELYQNFHLPGIVVGMFLLGIGCRAIYSRTIAAPVRPGAVVLYALLLPYIGMLPPRSVVGVGPPVILLTLGWLVATAYIGSNPLRRRRWSVQPG